MKPRWLIGFTAVVLVLLIVIAVGTNREAPDDPPRPPDEEPDNSLALRSRGPGESTSQEPEGDGALRPDRDQPAREAYSRPVGAGVSERNFRAALAAGLGPYDVAGLPGPRFRCSRAGLSSVAFRALSPKDASTAEPWVLRVRVVDDTGAGVPGAEVKVGLPDRGGYASLTRTSDGNGFLPDVPSMEGHYSLIVRSAPEGWLGGKSAHGEDPGGYGTASFSLDDGAPRLLALVVLDRAARARLRLDPVTGDGTTRIWTSLVASDGSYHGLPWRRPRHENGVVELTGLPSGQLWVFADREGYGSGWLRLRLKPGEEGEGVLRLEPGSAELSVRWPDPPGEGRPGIQLQRLGLHPQPAVLRKAWLEDERAEFKGLAPGLYVATFHMQRGQQEGFLPFARLIEVDTGANELTLPAFPEPDGDEVTVGVEARYDLRTYGLLGPRGSMTAFRRGASEWLLVWRGTPKFTLPRGTYESLCWLAPGGYGTDGRSYRREILGEATEALTFEFHGDW